MSARTAEELRRIVYGLPLAFARGDEEAADVLLEGLEPVEVEAVCQGLARMVVQTVEVLCEKTGEPDPMASVVRLLQAQALEAAGE
ncbi:secretion protein HlyD [Streptomyces sp. MBT55]|uniref:secretion protein HlyD n=1 Tax=Streptomyces sp. MBT55 TaxID=1488386 RepID=UPI001911830B|nr:secretion protein HlyD [Streptomyces sp. MBT55]MBK6040822.1 secretion protein HlyD [Streptomyces sp. MBT55]